jgi:hypothetical protein
MTASAEVLMSGWRPEVGQSGHWAWLAATTALLLPAVAHSVNFPSVSFLRLRTGALDLKRTRDDRLTSHNAAQSRGDIWQLLGN